MRIVRAGTAQVLTLCGLMRRDCRMLLLISVLLAVGCEASRPEWADGAMVRTERPRQTPAQDLANLGGRLLALHNQERAAVGAPPLAWDAQLAAAAAPYGPRLEQLGRLEHSPREARPGQAENLWMGTRGAYGIEEMVGGWIGEKRLFRPGTFPDVSSTGHWSDVAHYTQMIWGSTQRVGCALHRSARWDFLICRYSPPGNVAGQRVP